MPKGRNPAREAEEGAEGEGGGECRSGLGSGWPVLSDPTFCGKKLTKHGGSLASVSLNDFLSLQRQFQWMPSESSLHCTVGTLQESTTRMTVTHAVGCVESIMESMPKLLMLLGRGQCLISVLWVSP